MMNTDTNRITLTKSQTSWIATFTGPHAKDIIRLFSVASIPTAFTAKADSRVVLAEIQAENPGIEVVLGDV
jgi:hypothetical protein